MAERFYRMSANQGYGPAQYSLGWLYYNGIGLPQDHEQAAKWYCSGPHPVDRKEPSLSW